MKVTQQSMPVIIKHADLIEVPPIHAGASQRKNAEMSAPPLESIEETPSQCGKWLR